MAKCVMAVCGRLDCEMNYNRAGKCYNKTISLDENGKCVCYRPNEKTKYNQSKPHPFKDPFVEDPNIC